MLKFNEPPSCAAAAAAAAALAALASAAIRAAAAAACRPALDRSSRFLSGTPSATSLSSPLRRRFERVPRRPPLPPAPEGVVGWALLDSPPDELAASVLERVDFRDGG